LRHRSSSIRQCLSDRVWMAPAGQGRCSVGGSGRSRPW
jgi:hypothetical protein